MEAKQMLNAQAISSDNILTFYTDGFIANNRNNAADSIMRAAYYNSKTNMTIAFRVTDSTSFTNSEVKAALFVLENTSNKTSIHIHTNSQAIHNMLQIISSSEYRNF